MRKVYVNLKYEFNVSNSQIKIKIFTIFQIKKTKMKKKYLDTRIVYLDLISVSVINELEHCKYTQNKT